MKKAYVLIAAAFLVASSALAQVLPDVLTGPVKGTTLPNHTYTVLDSIIVKLGDTLKVSAGDSLIMASPTGWIQVLGTFICEGGPGAMNVITAPASRVVNGPGQWGGIEGDSCALVSVKYTRILWAGGNDYSGHARRTFDVFSDYQNKTTTVFTDNIVIGTVDDCIGLHGGNASVLRNTIKWCGAPDGDNINVKDGTIGEIAYNVIWSSGGNGIKLNANPNLLRITNMCIHNNTILAGGWRRVGELGYAILVDKSSRAQIYNNIMGDMYQELEVTTKADTLRTLYDNNLFFYSVDSLKGMVRWYPSDGVGRAAAHDVFDVPAAALFARYQPYFNNDWAALDGTNDYHVLPTSAAAGKGLTPPAAWLNPFFGASNLPGALNIGAMNVGVAGIVSDGGDRPAAFALDQNYPNPFNPTTVIGYFVPTTADVLLKVYNLLGQEVATLMNASQPAGSHSVPFNGAGLPTGMYIYRLQAGQFQETRKMLMLK